MQEKHQTSLINLSSARIGTLGAAYTAALHLSPKLQELSGYKTNALASLTVHFPIFLTLNYEHCCLLCVILLQKNGGKLGRPNPVQELQRLPFGESGTFNIALLLIRILALYSLHIWWDSLKLRG